MSNSHHWETVTIQQAQKRIHGDRGYMSTEVIWSKVKKLEGKDVTTIQGKKFHIYRVTDSDVYYDPLSTKSPGTHWSYRSTITELAKAIPTMKNRPRVWRLSNISELCEELSIKGEEQTPSYILSILSAIGVIQHATAGRVTDHVQP